MSKGIVISLCDLTGNFIKPWTRAGYKGYMVDIQHKRSAWVSDNIYAFSGTVEEFIPKARELMLTGQVKFVAGFPPCTDLAVSGSAHFAKKLIADKHYQAKAAQIVWQCHIIAEMIGCPYFVENPRSVLKSIWRKADFFFHPYEYGGYLKAQDVHPKYPKYIEPRDAYKKLTCLWTGGGFTMPPKKPVKLVGTGHSLAHRKLGGYAGNLTKIIRSSTPRGFSKAIYQHFR